MIFDRTIEDVRKAKEIRQNKVQKFIELTDDDVAVLERGTLTINTLNRIESKQTEVALMMNQMGYYGFGIQNKTWSVDDIFYTNDFERIVENEKVLRKGFLIYSTTPQVPSVEYHYSNINAIEKILNDIEVMMEDIKANYRECGTLECGGI